MTTLPFDVVHELPGWTLFWALLNPTQAEPAELASLRRRTADRVRDRFQVDTLASEPAVVELRRLFREAGTDPTRYRPSSEALLRRLIKGNPLPEIHPLVDLNNCLSAELPAPCCVMDELTIKAPFVLRAGRSGENYESFKGPFKLEGRPLLADSSGPCDAPITGSEKVKVGEKTGRAWLVAYLPAAVIGAGEARRRLDELLELTPLATVAVSDASGG